MAEEVWLLVKEWQKKQLDEEECFSRKTEKKKEMEEEKKTDNPSIGEWLPPTDNVTALERHARKEYSTLQYSAAPSIQLCSIPQPPVFNTAEKQYPAGAVLYPMSVHHTST